MTKKPKPNGQTTLTSDDWDLLINSATDFPYEVFEEKKVQVDESLFDQYLRLLKSGDLLPGTTFDMFEKNYMDFDTDIISKIKKRIRDQNRLEGIASIFVRSKGNA